MKTKHYISLLTGALLFVSCGPKYEIIEKSGFVFVEQQAAPDLAYSQHSGVRLLTINGNAFKDLNRNGKLDAYEDWRLPVDERAKDLASQMTVEQIAGLMLYSAHQAIPSRSTGYYGATYNGKSFDESGALPSDLSDAQLKFLKDDNLRHVLITTVESPAVAAQWNNNAQAYVEGFGLGIPINTSSDPRHNSDATAEYNAGAGGAISMWPTTLGLAASFDPELMRQFGEVAAAEYRAPRWSRFDGTMGEDPDLATDMARAYVDGMQTSTGSNEIGDGWGYSSVNAMVKHWPGGGPEEGGRDAHFGYGAYAVYPGNNFFADHLKPFTEGAFKLNGKTSKAAAVMPYYTISWERDSVNGEEVGNSYNKFLITDLLREKYGFDGVVCTDWMITKDTHSVGNFEGKCWGVENLSEAERHFKALEAGVDQFGGNNDMGPVIAAYQMGVAKYGEEAMRKRFEESAVRLLRNIFRVGLFENPYLDVEETKQIVGNPDYMKVGYEAQLRTVVMLKNHSQVLPLQKQLKVYIPERHVPSTRNWFGFEVPARDEVPFNLEIVKRYFEIVNTSGEADFALCGIRNPDGGVGYDSAELEKGGNGYVPISLQYGKYTATDAREKSIAGGSPFEDFNNRTYKGKTITAANHADMEMVLDTKKLMGEKPVVVVVKVNKPMVFAEIEPASDAILVHMGVQDQAIMDLISGVSEPSALLPFQMPANMKTVEEQYEDVPRDMTPYSDSDGNKYDFAYGLNWQGVISDERVNTYR